MIWLRRVAFQARLLLAPALFALALPGCAGMFAAQAAATGAMALGGATACEMTADDMMPRQHEEMEAHLDAFFKQGPLPLANATSRPRQLRLVDPGELTFPSEYGRNAGSNAEADALPTFPALPGSAPGTTRPAEAASPKFPRPGGVRPAASQASSPAESPDQPAAPSHHSSYMEEYQGFFTVWPLEDASGPLESWSAGEDEQPSPAER
jgi:hypothetical protein